MESTQVLIRSSLFFVVDLSQAIGHLRGHLLGLLVRAVRVLTVLRTRSFDRVQRVFHVFLLESLRSEPQHN